MCHVMHRVISLDARWLAVEGRLAGPHRSIACPTQPTHLTGQVIAGDRSSNQVTCTWHGSLAVQLQRLRHLRITRNIPVALTASPAWRMQFILNQHQQQRKDPYAAIRNSGTIYGRRLMSGSSTAKTSAQSKLNTTHHTWLNKWMNEWKCSDLKCVRKSTRSRLSLTHRANISSRWAE